MASNTYSRKNIMDTENILMNGGDINQKDENGHTRLMIACRNGLNAYVLYLINKGADVNIIDNSGWNALHHACHEYSETPKSYVQIFECIDMLLLKNVDAKIQSHHGFSALMLLMNNYLVFGKLGTTFQRINLKSDVTMKNNNNKTAADIYRSSMIMNEKRMMLEKNDLKNNCKSYPLF